MSQPEREREREDTTGSLSIRSLDLVLLSRHFYSPPHAPLEKFSSESFMPVFTAYPDAIKSSSNVQYSLQYKLYAMFIFFFFTALETLLNREDESEWLIHRWSPDSEVENTDTIVSSFKKWQTSLFFSFFFSFMPSNNIFFF